jgi:hypothetical protein
VGCRHCSQPGLAEARGLARKETRLQVVQKWGELAQVRVTATFRGAHKDRMVEAYARIEQAPLLAITAGSIETAGETICGRRLPVQEATRAYLYRRWRSTLDPLLVRREDAGCVTLRAFPVTHDAETKIVLEGFALVDGAGRSGTRIYRSADLCLVIRPLTEDTRKNAAFVDEVGLRALQVLDVRTAKRRHPGAWKKRLAVPCVPALEAAVRGIGTGIVTTETALVALPPGPTVPKNLVVRSSAGAPAPPASDPTPPPPPPTTSSAALPPATPEGSG